MIPVGKLKLDTAKAQSPPSFVVTGFVLEMSKVDLPTDNLSILKGPFHSLIRASALKENERSLPRHTFAPSR